MKRTIAVLASLLLATGAVAQSRGAFYGPFTGYEAEALSDVWPQIREAASWQDIDWRALGLRRAPGTPEAQRIMATNWGQFRQAASFADIDWGDYADDRARQASRYSDRAGSFDRQVAGREHRGYGVGPFTTEEAVIMGRVWPEIRGAAAFEDIDWRAYGLLGAPGSRDARRLMSRHWGMLREAAQFEDIDWRATTGYRVSSGNRPRG